MNKIIGALILMVLVACSNEEAVYKVTFTDEPNPVGVMSEAFEVSYTGKIVFLSNRFNPSNSIYQEYWFCELKEAQLDSLQYLLDAVKEADINFSASSDSLPAYKLKIDELLGGKRTSKSYIGTPKTTEIVSLIDFVSKVPDYTERFDINQAYYFSTEELCFKLLENK